MMTDAHSHMLHWCEQIGKFEEDSGIPVSNLKYSVKGS
jgi:hypothetical protein